MLFQTLDTSIASVLGIVAQVGYTMQQVTHNGVTNNATDEKKPAIAAGEGCRGTHQGDEGIV